MKLAHNIGNGSGGVQKLETDATITVGYCLSHSSKPVNR